MKNMIKNTLWAIRHPKFAFCWWLHELSYSTMHPKCKHCGAVLVAAAFMLAIGFTAQAQTLSLSSIQSLFKDGVITIGQPVTIKGQTFLVTTNADGSYVIFTTGIGGTATVTPPTTPAEALSQAQAMVAANNPTNASYYGTNELVGRVGAAYLQNSGQAVVEIGVEKYGLLKVMPQIGVGAALFQGNKSGQSGTAGAVGFADYRKVIGDVSAQVGVGGGYDNWNNDFMGVVKADIELRQNSHVGEYVGVGYALEPGHLNDRGGLIVRGGVNYAF
jgi:hypothetical protein